MTSDPVMKGDRKIEKPFSPENSRRFRDDGTSRFFVNLTLTPSTHLIKLILLLVSTAIISSAQPDPCATERTLLTSLEKQLQTAQDGLSLPNCSGPARTVCTNRINSLRQQIIAGQQYINRGCPAGTPVPPAPFDLVWTQSDDSGLPFAPIWYWQTTHDGAPPDPKPCLELPSHFDDMSCSTQLPSEDLPTGWNGTWCNYGASSPIDGHVNWFPVTYSGITDWSDHSDSDDDYNFIFEAPQEADLPSNVSVQPGPNNPRGFSSLLLEFDSDETIDHFHTPWWTKFHSAVDNGPLAGASFMVLNSQSTVIGLLGLDCEHDGCRTEIHPVYALVLEADLNPDDNTWVMFARNWGDEGYCSSEDHPLLAVPAQGRRPT
jgi:hypothetical protein